MAESATGTLELIPWQTALDASPRRYVLVRDGECLACEEGRLALLDDKGLSACGLTTTSEQYLGMLHTPSGARCACFAVLVEVDLALSALPDDAYWSLIRALLPTLDVTEFSLLSRALQLLRWRTDHAFCGRCGEATSLHALELAPHCLSCDQIYFPRISPCIITVVMRGDRCLLAQHAGRRSHFYASLAGFVEAGESLEDALHREVYEETRIRVKNIEYFGSQSWPFPGQLMVGFLAEYDGGEIEVDGEEILHADWFHYEELPQIPGRFTLSGQLIEAFVQRQQG